MHTTTNGSQGSVKISAYHDRLRIPRTNSPSLMKNGIVGHVPSRLASSYILSVSGVCGDHGGKEESRDWTWC